MHNALINTISKMDDRRIHTDLNDWKEGYNMALNDCIRDVKSLSTQIVGIQAVEALLKETYLEIANDYSVSDLHHDSDKVSCVASKFRQVMLDKLMQVNNEKKSTIKVVGSPEKSLFPMKIRCEQKRDKEGYVYGKPVDFCGRELEIEAHDVKKHKWFRYPDDHGMDYGIVCPCCKMFTIIHSDELPKWVKEQAEEINLD